MATTQMLNLQDLLQRHEHQFELSNSNQPRNTKDNKDSQNDTIQQTNQKQTGELQNLYL